MYMLKNISIILTETKNPWWVYLIIIGTIGLPFNLVNIYIKMNKKKKD